MLSNPLLVGAYFVAGIVLSASFTTGVRAWVAGAGLGQKVRSDGPPTHLHKSGTPTLGGLGFLAALTVLTGLLFLARQPRLSPAVPLALALALTYAAIGFADDYAKLRYQRSLGLKARARLPLEFLLAAAYAFLLVRTGVAAHSGTAAQVIPLGAGVGWIVFATVVIVATGNAVNLTDGLDGLASGVACCCALGLAAACWFLQLPDLALWSLGVAAVSAGFLWLNGAPASIWMGDVGSLGLGAALAAIAVAAHLELLLIIFGLVFVVEALSVIIQVGYFKLSGGKRVFRMAPYHHHLELGGMAETKVVTRFWVISLVAAAVGFALVLYLITAA